MKQVLSCCALAVLLTYGFFLQISAAEDTKPPAAEKSSVEKTAKELKDAEARAAQRQKDYDQALELYNKGLIAWEGVSKAEDALRRAKEDVQRARKNWEVAQKPQIPNPKSQIPNLKSQIPNPKSQIPSDIDAETKALIERLEKDLQQQKEALAQADGDITTALNAVKDIADELTKLPLDRDITTLHPLVNGAQPYLGVPYVFGGTTSRGIDCSGLVMRIAQRLGLNLPHSAAELFKRGEPIAKNLLKPGDLVFFRDTYKPGISHVGIYLGKGRFLHASSLGKSVVIGDLNQPLYVKHYAGARRLLSSTVKEEKK